NSIVVLENIVRQRQRGADRRTSALVGARQVTGAIIASTLTTCVIFLPVMFMRTTTSMLFLELAVVVVFALICSLFIAMALVPMPASGVLTVEPEDGHEHRPGRFAVAERWYTRTVSRGRDHRGKGLEGAAALPRTAAP